MLTAETENSKPPLMAEACEGEQKTGKYKWKLEEKKLTLTKVDDLCEGRSGALTSQVWVRE